MKNSIKGVALFLALTFVWAGSASAEVIRGKVSMIDLKANRVTLQAEGKDHSFTFDPQDFIVWKGDDEVKTDEIKTGAEAEVGYYTDETGIEIASWVDLTPAAEGEEVSVPTETNLPTVPAATAPAASEKTMAPAMPQPEAPSAMQPPAPPAAESPEKSPDAE